MPESEITTTILVQIRDGIAAMRGDLSEKIAAMHADLSEKIGNTNKQLVETNFRIDGMTARLDSLEQKLDVLNDNVGAIGRYAKNTGRRHDKAIDELRERVAKLEARRKN